MLATGPVGALYPALYAERAYARVWPLRLPDAVVDQPYDVTFSVQVPPVPPCPPCTSGGGGGDGGGGDEGTVVTGTLVLRSPCTIEAISGRSSDPFGGEYGWFGQPGDSSSIETTDAEIIRRFAATNYGLDDGFVGFVVTPTQVSGVLQFGWDATTPVFILDDGTPVARADLPADFSVESMTLTFQVFWSVTDITFAVTIGGVPLPITSTGDTSGTFTVDLGPLTGDAFLTQAIHLEVSTADAIPDPGQAMLNFYGFNAQGTYRMTVPVRRDLPPSGFGTASVQQVAGIAGPSMPASSSGWRFDNGAVFDINETYDARLTTVSYVASPGESTNNNLAAFAMSADTELTINGGPVRLGDLPPSFLFAAPISLEYALALGDTTVLSNGAAYVQLGSVSIPIGSTPGDSASGSRDVLSTGTMTVSDFQALGLAFGFGLVSVNTTPAAAANFSASINFAFTTGPPPVPECYTPLWTAPATWTISSLPACLRFDRVTGRLTGKPMQVGTYTITVTALDAAGRTLTRTYTLKVLPASTIAVTPPVLHDGSWGAFYTETLVAHSTGGSSFTFRVQSGLLPPGVTLSSSGALQGVITGGPAPDAYSVVVRVTDDTPATVDRPYTIAIRSTP